MEIPRGSIETSTKNYTDRSYYLWYKYDGQNSIGTRSIPDGEGRPSDPNGYFSTRITFARDFFRVELGTPCIKWWFIPYIHNKFLGIYCLTTGSSLFRWEFRGAGHGRGGEGMQRGRGRGRRTSGRGWGRIHRRLCYRGNLTDAFHPEGKHSLSKGEWLRTEHLGGKRTVIHPLNTLPAPIPRLGAIFRRFRLYLRLRHPAYPFDFDSFVS